MKRHLWVSKAGPHMWRAFVYACQALAAALVFGPVTSPQALADRDQPGRGGPGLVDRGEQTFTIDHFVPHISTVPANQGELVHLFVRERTSGSGLLGPDGAAQQSEHNGGHGPAVLIVHGRSVPVLALADLGSDDYNWSLSLARAGIDVFMMDFQGSGRSTHPSVMDDACNVPSGPLGQGLLIPDRPLASPCTARFTGPLNTAESDQAELDRVVNYIRELRRIDKVHLISWSQGSFRIGPYAVEHPEKVASVFFLALIFNTIFDPAPPPVGTQTPPATPISLRRRVDVFEGNGSTVGWDPEVKAGIDKGCIGQREVGIQDLVWTSIMDNDPVGRRWGPPATFLTIPRTSIAPERHIELEEGLIRVREPLLGAWNKTVVQGTPATKDTPAKPPLSVPTLIIRGENDTGQGARQQVKELYDLVNTANKLRFTVQCAGHYMAWERQRTVLHDISKQWIKTGQVAGYEQGVFVVDIAGNLLQDPQQ